MDKVFILYEYYPYEDVQTLGVYSSLDEAKAALLEIKGRYTLKEDENGLLRAIGDTIIYIEEHEVLP